MSSKNRLIVAILLPVFVMLSACGEFLRGQKSEPEVMELSDAKFACLQSLPSNLENFTLGIAQEQEIRSSIDCLSEALRYFQKRTFGSEVGAYTVDEMRRFFSKYFLKENVVTPEFATELMKIKASLLGGSIRHITKLELSGLIQLLEIVKEEAILLSPHMRILINQKSLDSDISEVNKSTSQLRKSLHRLLNATQIDKHDYSFEDAKKALRGFADFIQGSDLVSPYENYAKWLPLVEAVKIFLVGEYAQFRSLVSWGQNLDTLIDIYSLTLQFQHLMADGKIEGQNEVRQLGSLARQALNVLERSHQMKQLGHIPLKDIDNLIDQVVARMPVFEGKPSAYSLKKTYRVVLVRMLENRDSSDSRSLVGFEKKHLSALKRELNTWSLSQIFIDTIFRTPTQSLTQQQLQAAHQEFAVANVIDEHLSKDPLEQRSLKESWIDFGKLLNRSHPVSFDAIGRVKMGSRFHVQNWSSLTRFNVMRSLTRLLMLGYAEKIQGPLHLAQMKEQGLIAWYDDFNELGIDIKAFDKRMANSGARSFKEANFFTFSGNGDNWMDHNESFEFISILLSAGLLTSGKLQDQAAQSGCAIAERDVLEKNFLTRPCFKDYLKNQFGVYFSNLPGMVKYVESLSIDQWDQFYTYLEKAAAAPEQKPELVETANIRTLVMILHYIESVMVTYDQNLSQGLSVSEINAATPRFMSFLRTVGPGKPDSVLRQGFAHLVFKGFIPNLGDLLIFQGQKWSGLGEAQRMEIARLFGTLKEKIK